MLKLKDSTVNVGALVPEMYFATAVVECVFAEFGLDPILTSAVDGTHNRQSIHGRGEAIDIRSTPETSAFVGDQITEKLRFRLERRGFDVCDERKRPEGKVWSGPHWHIEFQPKQGERFWR